MFGRVRPLPIAALVLLLAIAASACGGASSDASPTEGSEGRATTPAGVALSGAEQAPALEGKQAQRASSASESASQATGRKRGDKLAPELAGISGWINTEPLTLAAQRGKVVLIDFWTYTCVNCLRTLPYLRDWHAKYADKGLVIIGVHAPEFEFEKKRDNVVNAAGEHRLPYAIAQDNEFETWRAFNNRYWPAKYLIDREGFIRYTHFGEGAYDETEERIRELLLETGATLSGISVGSRPEPAVESGAFGGSARTSLTRELYAGFKRNLGALLSDNPPYIIQRDYYENENSDVAYEDPGEHENHFIYLHGLWRNTPESLVHARQTEDLQDYVLIKFFATEVNLVMDPDRTRPFQVRLTLDGAPLTASQAGADVRFDADGNSYVPADSPRMYNLVRLGRFEGHELKLSSNSPEFALFAFTFGGYKSDDQR